MIIVLRKTLSSGIIAWLATYVLFYYMCNQRAEFEVEFPILYKHSCVLKVSMLEGKLSNYSIKNSEMDKRITLLSKKEEDSVLTDKLLNDANQDLKG